MARRLLVVDDSSVMRKILCRVLTQAGFEPTGVVEASDDAEALEKYRPEEIDLILSDWHMPNMDGLEFVRQVRARDTADKRVPIVMVTTEGSQSKIEEAEKEGVDAYITKPFTPDGIKQSLGPIIEQIG